jgi:hypothetical protein
MTTGNGPGPGRLQGGDNAERRFAAAVEKWVARPRRQTNLAAISATGVAMLWLLAATWQEPGRLAFLRGVALLCIGLHGVLHMFVLHVLRRLLQERGTPAVGKALQAYLDRRRLSNLDLAIAWVGFALLVSILDGLFALALPAGG